MITRLGLVAAALIAGCASALAQVPSGPGATSFSQISGQVSPSQLPAATTVSLGAVSVSTGLGVSSGALSVTYGTAAGTAAQGNDARLGSNVAITGGAINGTPIGATTPSTIAATTLNASGNDALLYDNTSGQSIPNNAVTTVTGWTQEFDRLGANFNASTGVFTAPATGIYQVGGQLCYAAVAGAVSVSFQARVVANGATVAAGQVQQEAASTVVSCVIIPMTDVSLSASQTLVVQAYQTTGSALALNTAAPMNTLSINRLP